MGLLSKKSNRNFTLTWKVFYTLIVQPLKSCVVKSNPWLIQPKLHSPPKEWSGQYLSLEFNVNCIHVLWLIYADLRQSWWRIRHQTLGIIFFRADLHKETSVHCQYQTMTTKHFSTMICLNNMQGRQRQVKALLLRFFFVCQDSNNTYPIRINSQGTLRLPFRTKGKSWKGQTSQEPKGIFSWAILFFSPNSLTLYDPIASS